MSVVSCVYIKYIMCLMKKFNPLVTDNIDTVKNDVMARNLDFGRYAQQMLPKYVQQSQVSHG